MPIQVYSGGDTWIRRWSVVVTDTSGSNLLELSAGVWSSITGGPAATGPQGQPLSEGLRTKFRTVAYDSGTPNHAEIFVYNLSDATARRLINREFSQVVLQAGYAQGRFGEIFSGSIKQVKRTRESAVDTVLIIYASDMDFYQTQHVIEPQYIPAQSTREDQFKAIQDEAVKNGGLSAGTIQSLGNSGVISRGKTLFGMGNAQLDATSRTFGQWSIQNGRFQFIKTGGYLEGEQVILNVHSGLVGIPEVTDQGVFVTALLNPAVKVGTQIKINNADVNTSEPAVGPTVILQQGYPGVGDIFLPANTSDDGTYAVRYVEYSGDTRGNEWYMKLLVQLIDPGTKEIVALQTPKPPPEQPGQIGQGTAFPGHN